MVESRRLGGGGGGRGRPDPGAQMVGGDADWGREMGTDGGQFELCGPCRCLLCLSLPLAFSHLTRVPVLQEGGVGRGSREWRAAPPHTGVGSS